MQLTPEQLRKSAVAALDAVGERGCNRCFKDLRFALGIGTVETMITAAFAAVEPEQGEPETGEPTKWSAQDHRWEYEQQGLIESEAKMPADMRICPKCNCKVFLRPDGRIVAHRSYGKPCCANECSFDSFSVPEQVDVPGDLVERMICAFCSYDAGEHITYNAELFRKMTAALRVALKDPRVLGEPTRDEMNIEMVGNFEEDASALLASRRARLLPSKTVEERVTVDRVYEDEGESEDRLFCDGKEVCKADVLDYARSHLIAKLKAEGTVSREAGGNAQ